MFKKILVAIGLRKAPPPVRSFLTTSMFVGVFPAAAMLAWRYRDEIRQQLVRMRRDARPAH